MLLLPFIRIDCCIYILCFVPRPPLSSRCRGHYCQVDHTGFCCGPSSRMIVVFILFVLCRGRHCWVVSCTSPTATHDCRMASPDDVLDSHSCCSRRLTVPLHVGTDIAERWRIFSAIIIVEGFVEGLDEEGEGRLKNCSSLKSHQLGWCLEIGELGCRNF